jgi:hypothetical protein
MLLSGQAHADLIHDYEFNGNLTDSLGGPALAPIGGSLNPSFQAFDFSQRDGLSLSSWGTIAQAHTYTIDLSFKFADVSGYRKIIDTTNLQLDTALYDINGNLSYYYFGDHAGAGAPIAPNTYVRVDITRDDATQLIKGYVDGLLQFTYTDTTNNGRFDGPNNIIQFFRDDVQTGGNEVSAGEVNQIRIYDSVLSAADVFALGGPKAPTTTSAVPEPSTLMVAGLGALGFVAYGLRRRNVIGR